MNWYTPQNNRIAASVMTNIVEITMNTLSTPFCPEKIDLNWINNKRGKKK